MYRWRLQHSWGKHSHFEEGCDLTPDGHIEGASHFHGRAATGFGAETDNRWTNTPYRPKCCVIIIKQ